MKIPGALLAAMAAVLAAAGCGSSGATVHPSAAVGSASSAAPIGVWTATITEDDFHEAGLNDAGLSSENAGTFRFTVNDDGTYTEAQQAEHPVRWPVFRGTWSDEGPRTIGLRTTFPADFVGEYIVVEWSRSENVLHLRLVSPQDPVLKVHFEAYPWQPVP
jgi:hypothetical protein